jgi:hypothetical protein
MKTTETQRAPLPVTSIDGAEIALVLNGYRSTFPQPLLDPSLLVLVRLAEPE